MRAVVQRVADASVEVEGRIIGSIKSGLLVYIGVGKSDGDADVRWLADKILSLRIFPDDEYKINFSVADLNGGVLVVSQFTLYADARKGRRPSYNNAAEPEPARVLYESFVAHMRESGLEIQTGEYQAVMDVRYTNKGPVTILLDTEKTF